MPSPYSLDDSASIEQRVVRVYKDLSTDKRQKTESPPATNVVTEAFSGGEAPEVEIHDPTRLDGRNEPSLSNGSPIVAKFLDKLRNILTLERYIVSVSLDME